MGRLKIIGLLAWAAAAPVTNVAPAQTPELAEAWLDARAAIRDGAYDLTVERRLRRYALYPYLEAESIIATLRRPELLSEATERADDFLREHADTAIEDAFRRDLLLALAERELWEEFVRFYSPVVANESRECEYLSARVRLGQTSDLAGLVERRWLTPRRLDADCEPAFEWLRRHGTLDDELTARRVAMLLENGQSGFARIIAQRLPDAAAEAYRQWAQMLDEPLASIAAM